jgi:hypothetical protein
MKLIRIRGLAILTVFAVTAVTATVAQASEGPFYKVNGARLLEGETIEIGAKGTAETKLEATGIVVGCKSLKLAKGAVIIGSGKGSAGTGKETIEFEGCKLTGNGEKCILAKADKGIIATEPVKTTLDYPKKAPAKGDTLLMLFQPAAGSVFVKIKVEAEAGGKCTVSPEIAVEGSLAGETLDNNKTAIKLEEEPAEAEVGYVRFPAAATEACTESGKVVTCKTPKLTVSTKTAKLTGVLEVTITIKFKWGIFGK